MTDAADAATLDVGDVLSRFTLPVDGSKAEEMAVAVGASADSDAVVPTFTATSGFRQDRQGMMTGPLGMDISRTLHGEQRYRFSRRLRVGDRLHGVTRLDDVRTREGARGGTMRLVTLQTVYTDAAHREVLHDEMLLIEVARANSGADVEDGGEDSDVCASDDRDQGSATVANPVPVEAERIGQARTLPTVTRTDIVRYAGAAGDFTRIHHDEPYARALGLPSVFAMGMLAGGTLAAWVDGLVGGGVREVVLRFSDRVWPGDVLTCHAWRPDGAAPGALRAAVVSGAGAAVVTLRGVADG